MKDHTVKRLEYWCDVFGAAAVLAMGIHLGPDIMRYFL